MPTKMIEEPQQFNLIGTQFVKKFREYLISLYRENKNISDNEVCKKAFMDMSVKPETTRRYIKELKELNII